MKYLYQFLIIIGFSLLGEALNLLLPLPVPASIYGIILLFAALELKIVKVKDVREVSRFLILVMPIMFVPPAVGLIPSWGFVKGFWWQYLLVTVVSTIVVMAVSGLVTQCIIRFSQKKSDKKAKVSQK